MLENDGSQFITALTFERQFARVIRPRESRPREETLPIGAGVRMTTSLFGPRGRSGGFCFTGWLLSLPVILASIPDHSQELAGPGDPTANPRGLTGATCGLSLLPDRCQLPLGGHERDTVARQQGQQPVPTLHPWHRPG